MPEKLILLGGSGYIGTAFQRELARRGVDYKNLTRSAADYTRFATLLDVLRGERPTFLINCAGYTGKPNVDACESNKADTLLGNAILPATIAHACEIAGVPWAHISSGCIYTGAKLTLPNPPRPPAIGNQQPATDHRQPATGHQPPAAQRRILRNLMDPAVRPLWENNPERLAGFTELDAPNFSFRAPPCSVYSGSKALGEETIADAPNTYIWRLRIPFDEEDNPRNYLTKLQRYERVYDNANSLSHRGDFVRACLDLWRVGAPFGTYNVTNPGWTTTRDVVRRLEPIVDRPFEFFESDEAFNRAVRAPRSNTILDTKKLQSTGISIRPVEEALEEAITTGQWQETTAVR